MSRKPPTEYIHASVGPLVWDVSGDSDYFLRMPTDAD
jgi:hypothetical protein